MLPTGTIFAFRIPDPEDMVKRGLIPEELRRVALKFAAQAEQNAAELDTDELTKMLRLFRGMVAQMLRYIWQGDEEPIDAWAQFDPSNPNWQPVTLTAADFEEVMIEGDDYAALQAIVQRQVTAKGVTALALRDRNLITLDEFDKMIAGESSKTVSAWASFRGNAGSSEPGARGEGMERAPVGVGIDNRSARRARARRRTSDPARGGAGEGSSSS